MTDEYVTAFDIDGAADGAYAPSVTVSADVVQELQQIHLTLLLQEMVQPSQQVRLRVYAVLADVSDMGGDGFNANEVDRDTLA